MYIWRELRRLGLLRRARWERTENWVIVRIDNREFCARSAPAVIASIERSGLAQN